MLNSLSHVWGTTPAERLLAFPCDPFIPNPDDSLFRGVTICASPRVVFLWLCQLRAAPYSYDLIDNGGRQSPQELTPGLDNLSVGLDVMGIFNLVDFESDRHLTLRVKPRSRASGIFGDFAISYVIAGATDSGSQPSSPAVDSCRLLVKLIVNYPPGPKGWFMKIFLPLGDLIMMRRQLLNFKQLAENCSVSG